ncbi:MAG: dihydropteroate synthase [Proteobacteria bacterium]|nr:dihydropteroate synthase [Pseudomonadota bacterium]
MGIVNITPDSFSDGGDYFDPETAVAHGLAMVEEGADILDVGGESTRPGAEPVGEGDEKARVLPVIRSLAEKVSVPISVDTYKSSIAAAAIEAGASMINDISAGRFDPAIFDVAARTGVPMVLMHMRGVPRSMQARPVYDDLVSEVKTFLHEAAGRAEAAGVAPDRIILDPGIGFGKTFGHNWTLIKRLRELVEMGYPMLVGPSRKAFLGYLLGGAPPKARDSATAAVVALAAYLGAHFIRTHNVQLARETLTVVRAVMKADD